MIRANAAVGGCITASTLPCRWINACRREDALSLSLRDEAMALHLLYDL